MCSMPAKALIERLKAAIDGTMPLDNVQVLVTEQGLADLRGLSPKERAKLVIEKCAAPEYKGLLKDYLSRSEQLSYGKHTPHLLTESLGWHSRYLRTGNMRAREEN